jgi:hypothetical protein
MIRLILALLVAAPLFSGDWFLFTSFRKNGETGVFFALSSDGRRWTPLNDNQPWVKPGEPGMLMRDPWLGQGPDGTWHMIWTWGWTRADMGGRLKIGYTSSKDLIAWTPQRAIFAMDNEPEARNAWAPEAVWDAAAKEWIVFWASTIPGRFRGTDASGDTDYNHRIYATTTKDWQTFSPSRLWFDPGGAGRQTLGDGVQGRAQVAASQAPSPGLRGFSARPLERRKRAVHRRLGGRADGGADRAGMVDLFRPLHRPATLRRDAHHRLENLRRRNRAGELSRGSPAWDGH